MIDAAVARSARARRPRADARQLRRRPAVRRSLPAPRRATAVDAAEGRRRVHRGIGARLGRRRRLGARATARCAPAAGGAAGAAGRAGRSRADAFERCNLWLLDTALGLGAVSGCASSASGTARRARGPAARPTWSRRCAPGLPMIWLDARAYEETLARRRAAPREVGAMPQRGLMQRRQSMKKRRCRAGEIGRERRQAPPAAAGRGALAAHRPQRRQRRAPTAAGPARWPPASSTPTTWRRSPRRKGMRPTVLLTKKATRATVLAALRSAAKALQRRRPVLPHLFGPRRPGARRQRRRARQARRDLVPVRRPADRRRALLRAQPLRRRRAHPGAVRQLPQRHRHPRRPRCRRAARRRSGPS